MNEEQRWAKTGLMVSAGAHAFLGGVALFYGALFNAPDDEPIEIMQTAIISEEEFAEIAGNKPEDPEPPRDILASAEPPPPSEPAEQPAPDIAEPEPQDPEPQEPAEQDLAKAPYEVAPPPPPPLQPPQNRDRLAEEKIREALDKPDPEVFKDPEQPKEPVEDQVAEVDFSDRIDQDACAAAQEMRTLCSAEPGRCAEGSSLAGQLSKADDACKAEEERLAEAKRQEEERLKQEERRKEEERLAEEQRKQEAAEKAEQQKQAMRQTLREALKDLKRQAAIKERREAAARKKREEARRKQAKAGADLIDDLLDLDTGQQPVSQPQRPVVEDRRPLSGGEKAALAFNFKREWEAPDPDSLDVRDLVVELEVRLDLNGNVLGEPKVLAPAGALTTRQTIAIFSAKRAVKLGAPHKGPPEKYSRWRLIHITYDPVRREAIIN